MTSSTVLRGGKDVRRSRSARAVVLVGLFSLVGIYVSSAAAAVSITGVLTGRSDTWDPSAGMSASTGDTFLAWTLYRHAVPGAYLRIDADPRLKLNSRGIGWAWSMDVSATTAAYQQERHGNSDVRFYDWTTAGRSSPGSGVNTTRWEYEPALSGHWLVFARLNRAATPDRRRIILYNLLTKRSTVLATFTGSAATGTLQSPEIDGDWVTWTSMSDRYTRSSVHRYQISTGRSYRIRHPSGSLDYLSSVGPDGTVYFLRSKPGCGRHVTFEQYTTARVLTSLGSMPSGRDGGDEMFAVAGSDGSVRLYFDSYRCTATNGNGNVYVLDAAPSTANAGSSMTFGSSRRATGPKRFPEAVRRKRSLMEGGFW